MGKSPVHLDGPGLVAWLKREGITLSNLTESEQRRWNEWKHGGTAYVYGTIDKLLTRYGFTTNEIPENLWKATRPIAPGKQVPKLTRQLIRDGKTNREIAALTGRKVETIARYRRAMRNP